MEKRRGYESFSRSRMIMSAVCRQFIQMGKELLNGATLLEYPREYLEYLNRSIGSCHGEGAWKR